MVSTREQAVLRVHAIELKGVKRKVAEHRRINEYLRGQLAKTCQAKQMLRQQLVRLELAEAQR